MKNTEYRERLKALLQSKAIRWGEFKLRSGKLSDFYFDCKQVSLEAEGLFLLGQLFFHELQQFSVNIEGVGGPTLGADPLVCATSLCSYMEKAPMSAFIIRKEPKAHGTGRWIEGIEGIAPDAKVAILEDVVTTGYSTIQAIKHTREAGLEVVAVIVVVDREEGGREQILQDTGLSLKSLFTKSDFRKS